MITNEGLTWLQTNDVEATTLYLGLISSTSFAALAVTDTMASHAGWTEYTGYSESTRVEWAEVGSSNGHMSNPAGATFTFNATGQIYGCFLASNSTKGGSTGTLIATVLSDRITRVSGETVRVIFDLDYVSV